jgi:hypothetical protein
VGGAGAGSSGGACGGLLGSLRDLRRARGALVVGGLVDGSAAARERRGRGGHGRELLAGRELGRGVEPLSHRGRLVVGGAGDGLEQGRDEARLPALCLVALPAGAPVAALRTISELDAAGRTLSYLAVLTLLAALGAAIAASTRRAAGRVEHAESLRRPGRHRRPVWAHDGSTYAARPPLNTARV